MLNESPDSWRRELLVVLEEAQHVANDELSHQLGQLGASLRDFLYDLFNYPLVRPWPESLAIFAEHWTDRGLQLTPKTLQAIWELIAEELGGGSHVFDAEDLGAYAPEAAEASGIMLASARPSRGGQRRKTSKKPRRGRRKATSPALPHGKRFPGGKWVKGVEGNGLYRLDKPIRLSTGPVVKEIPYQDGLPIFDKWAVKGEDVVIAITGEHGFDQPQALKAWKDHTGKTQPKKRHVFHHDGLSTKIGEHRGKKIFTSRMQLVPEELNRLAHVGSAKMARDLGVDPGIAREVNDLAIEGKGPLGRIRKRLLKQVGERLKLLRKGIPIIGGALTLIFFTDDVEAHGVGGALVRATPLLGDLVGAYDLGNELAAKIREEANQQLQEAYADANDPARFAHAAARRQTAAAFNELAKAIRVTKYMQPNEIAEAVQEPLLGFYGEVFLIYSKMYRGGTVTDPRGAVPTTTEKAIEVRMRRAKEALNRELRNKLQQAPGVPLS